VLVRRGSLVGVMEALKNEIQKTGRACATVDFSELVEDLKELGRLAAMLFWGELSALFTSDCRVSYCHAGGSSVFPGNTRKVPQPQIGRHSCNNIPARYLSLIQDSQSTDHRKSQHHSEGHMYD